METVGGTENQDTHPHSGEFTPVCSISELSESGKKRIPIEGRDVTLWKVGKQVFAMDSVCYHLGGPLDEGDIESVGDRLCVVCPWHKYKIDVATGEGIYKDMQGKLCTKGKRQRVHHVKIDYDADTISVKIEPDNPKEKLPSDDYAYKELYKIKKPPPTLDDAATPGFRPPIRIHSTFIRK